jgi:hypothetical protein
MLPVGSDDMLFVEQIDRLQLELIAIEDNGVAKL